MEYRTKSPTEPHERIRQPTLRAFAGEHTDTPAENFTAATYKCRACSWIAFGQSNHTRTPHREEAGPNWDTPQGSGSKPRSMVLLCSLLLIRAACHGQHLPAPTSTQPRTMAPEVGSAATLYWDTLGSDDTVFTLIKEPRIGAGHRMIHAHPSDGQPVPPVQPGQTILFVVEPVDSSFLPCLFRWKPAK